MKRPQSSHLLRPTEVDRLIRQVRSLRRRWSKEDACAVALERPEFDEIIVHLDPSPEIAAC